MRIRISVPEEHVSPHVVNAALEAVTRVNESMLASGQAPTSRDLVRSGAIWRPEPPGDEHFDNAATIAQRGWGDCDDWAPAHAATLRASGEDPGARAVVVPSGPNMYHAIVQRSDGSIDDPSIAAGMKPVRKGKVGGPDGESIEILACDPHDPSRVYEGSLLPTTSPMSLHCGPTFAVRAAGPGIYEARCDVPVAGCQLAGVRAHVRHAPHLHRHAHRGRVHGALPYALAVSSYGDHPATALRSAVVGAVMCGQATRADTYRLMALEGGLCGMHPRDIHASIVGHLCAEGCPPDQANAEARAHVIGAMRMARRYVRGHRAAMAVHGVAAAAMPVP